MSYDVLIIGGGIAGMESAINLGDMGYKVLVVEKSPSIGGKMILLSKVFPTLDCASCIATPKMAQTAHHPNVDIMVYSEVKEVERKDGGGFRVKVYKKPTYINEDACTGCQHCEFACTVAVPDEFNYGMVSRRAAYIAFPQAIPKKAVIDRQASSPCTYYCPAGIKAHGYISLSRSGKYDEAFGLIAEATPFVGTLGRACFAPCEAKCTRGELEGSVPIRRIKRFLADRYYESHPSPSVELPERKSDKRVAIVGSGPAGLTAAYHLARMGHVVKVFEAEDVIGGLPRTVIPSYRLPEHVLERDVKNVTSLGVDIETGKKITSLNELKKQGFDAVFVAVGASAGKNSGIEGEELDGVYKCIDFLKGAKFGKALDLKGKRVLVVGGGNAAIDPARVALRLGASRVVLEYRRTRDEMPASEQEIRAAEDEGVEFCFLSVPVKFLGENGKLKRVVSQKMELGEPDSSGRRRPIPISGAFFEMEMDLVVMSIGNVPSTSEFSGEVELNSNGTIKVDPETLQSSVPFVFSGGDAVLGPSSIAEACGQGWRAAYYIDRFLKGEPLEAGVFDDRLPVVDAKDVLSRQDRYSVLRPGKVHELSVADRICSFDEVELPMSEEEVEQETRRCLDCGICSECHQCVKACPANAIDFSKRGEELDIEAGAVITSIGFNLFPAQKKALYGYGRFRNVIDAMQMDRLLSPTRPYNTVLRPSDGKVPDSIAFVLCTGSRDHLAGNPICSRVCCMYSLKQAQLLMGALPLADITVYYIDIRAFGKGFEEFYEQARSMGVNLIKGKVSRITPAENDSLVLHYEDIEGDGGIKTAEHDLVVLSVGFLPNVEAAGVFKDSIELEDLGYIREVDEDLNPGVTSIDGVYVAGTSSGPMDIPDTILHAGASVVHAASYIEKLKGSGE